MPFAAEVRAMSEEAYQLIEKWSKLHEFTVVGKGLTRVDALEKALGQARYVEDYSFDRMVWIKSVRSKHPHGLIKGIDASGALAAQGVVGVFTARDVPGINEIGYALPDQPLLANVKVRFSGEAIALVAAENPSIAEEAAEMVSVDYKPLPAVYDPIEAMTSSVLVHEEHGSNIASTTRLRKGDVAKGFDQSDFILENTYATQPQEHAYLEPECAVATPDPSGITIIGSIQSPFVVHGTVARALGLRHSQVRIVSAVVGGAFGGKDDVGAEVCARAGLVALKTRRPAMLVHSREESIVEHNKRYASRIDYKTGVRSDGKLMAVKARIVLDGGAYANRGPFVLWRMTVHITGPYEVPNVEVGGSLVYTNKVYGGSFRGFGNAKVHFAVESQMDEVAEKLGMDPIEFRLKNVLRPGSLTATSQLLDHSVGAEDVLRAARESSGWSKKRQEYRDQVGNRRRGIGVGAAWHGISTSRGVPDWSAGSIIIYRDGSVLYRTGITEMGQGSHTGHVQTIAEILGAPISHIRIDIPDTSSVPDSGPTHGSRGTMMGGTAALVAATRIRERLNRLAAELLACDLEDIEIKDGKAYSRKDRGKVLEWRDLIEAAFRKGVELSSYGHFYGPKGTFDHEVGQGTAYIVYSYVANVVEVEVDIDTGQVTVLKVYPVADVGRVINPALVDGQIHGGIVQGLGYALMENVIIHDGCVLNPNFTDYVIPTSMDIPVIEKSILLEHPYRYGPLGAKGVGEMALIPAAAAIANAVSHATGVRIRELPMTAEKVFFALKKHQERG